MVSGGRFQIATLILPPCSTRLSSPSGSFSTNSYACAIYECNLLYVRDGMSETYQNGENQWGVKKSVAAELRPKYTATYQSLIKQLTGLLPSEDEKAVAAELMEFIRTA